MTPAASFGAKSAAGKALGDLALGAGEVISRIRGGELRAETYVERLLQALVADRSMNIVTWVDSAAVLERARAVDRARSRGRPLAALAGLPVLVKDNIDTVGFPTSAGTPALMDYIPAWNATVVERLVKQGAIVLAKANMHELAMGGTSSNPTFGPVHNPYAFDRVPGGSSGGSAAGLALHVAPAALGTDTAGSVRIPSAFCGTVGFRPSTFPSRVYSSAGVVPMALDLDTIGPMARSVADVRILHAAIVRRQTAVVRPLSEVRIGIPRSAFWSDLDPQVEAVANEALHRLAERGATFVEVDMRAMKDAQMRVFTTLLYGGCPADLFAFLHAHVPSLSLKALTEQVRSRDVRAMLENPRPIAAAELAWARGIGRKSICAEYVALFRKRGLQAIAFPTEVILPPLIRPSGDGPNDTIELNGRQVSETLNLVRNTTAAAALGAPGLSLPAGLSRERLPVGLELDGLPGQDGTLLEIGMAAEAALGRLPAHDVIH